MLQGSAIWEKLKATLSSIFKKYGKKIHMKIYGFLKKIAQFLITRVLKIKQN